MRIVGERVAALRIGLRMTQKDLRAAIKTLGGKLSQQQLSSIEKNGAKRSGSLRELAIALQTTEEYLLRLTDDPKPGSNVLDVTNPLRETASGRTLDVWRVTHGGAMSWVMEEAIIDQVTPLSGLEKATEAHAFRVPDDALSPGYEENDIAFVDLSVTGLHDQHCMFCREIPGNKKKYAFILRKLLGQTSTHWKVMQHSPERRYDLAKKDWPLVFKLQGKRAR